MDKKAVVNLAVDIYNNRVSTEFASADKHEQMEVLRAALIEANGGSKELSYKSLRNNIELFEIIETLITLTDHHGFEKDDFFNEFVEYRNKSLGDKDLFYIEDNSLFVVDETAEGISSTLRQRINKGTHQSVPTSLKTIEVYEELNRLLSGRQDLVSFVNRIQESFAKQKLNTIYQTFYNGISGLPAEFKATGTFTESNLQDIIAHVEASTNKEAIILGTKKGLSKITSAVISEQSKERYNQLGYYGVFNGTRMMNVRQSHKIGSFDFAISDNDLWVVASGGKPVKFVTEGDAIFEVGSATKNKDRTVDILAGDRYGVGIVLDQYYGQYRIS